MGGCRCSFRTCSVRTDGKTHMFHFPVYDKVRCHQWIINAKRYEFFNLTVSQVRNRVVCQHHFKDDCFMNYKKEKLIFDAVPTENGPYCDSNEDEIHPEAAEAYSSIINDIENESTYLDKKANSSLKYVDFLTNFDVPQLGVWHKYIVPPKVKPNKESVTKSQIKRFQDLIKVGSSGNKQHKSAEDHQYNLKLNDLDISQNSNKCTVSNDVYQESNKINIGPYNIETKSNLLQNLQPVNETGSTVLPVDRTPFYVNPTNLNSINKIITEESRQENNFNLNKLQNTTILHNKVLPKESRVKIISEKTLSEPLPIIGEFKPVSPSLRLRARNKNRESIEIQNKPETPITKIIQSNHNEMVQTDAVETNITKNPESESCKDLNNKTTHEEQKIEIEIDTKFSVANLQNLQLHDIKSKNKEQVPKLSILKSKIAPERVAAIEKKRNFNKKLRDIVESCLENSDNQKATNILKVKDTENFSNNVDAYPSKESRLAGTQEYKTMASLEARIIKMENMLVKKIEQNTERISDLKSSFARSKSSSVYTQTSTNQESYKKYLYNELSKYLTPGTSSLVYEELFLNKYAQKLSECEPKPKRRRGR